MCSLSGFNRFALPVPSLFYRLSRQFSGCAGGAGLGCKIGNLPVAIQRQVQFIDVVVCSYKHHGVDAVGNPASESAGPASAERPP